MIILFSVNFPVVAGGFALLAVSGVASNVIGAGAAAAGAGAAAGSCVSIELSNGFQQMIHSQKYLIPLLAKYPCLVY